MLYIVTGCWQLTRIIPLVIEKKCLHFHHDMQFFTLTCDSLPIVQSYFIETLYIVTIIVVFDKHPDRYYWCGIMNTQYTEIKLNHVSLGLTFETKISRMDNITESKWWATVALSYLFPDADYRWLSNILWTVVGESKLTCRYNEIQIHCIKS